MICFRYVLSFLQVSFPVFPGHVCPRRLCRLYLATRSMVTVSGHICHRTSSNLGVSNRGTRFRCKRDGRNRPRRTTPLSTISNTRSNLVPLYQVRRVCSGSTITRFYNTYVSILTTLLSLDFLPTLRGILGFFDVNIRSKIWCIVHLVIELLHVTSVFPQLTLEVS